MAVSLRNADAEEARPAPELVRLLDAVVVGSAPGTGEGALDPLIAAALIICALS